MPTSAVYVYIRVRIPVRFNAFTHHFRKSSTQLRMYILSCIIPQDICAEWPGGGMPDWLGQIPGMHPRSPTQPYEDVCYDWMHQHIEHVVALIARTLLCLCRNVNTIDHSLLSSPCSSQVRAPTLLQYSCVTLLSETNRPLLCSAITRTDTCVHTLPRTEDQ